MAHTRATGAASGQAQLGLYAVYDLDMGHHVVFARELLVADRARVILDVGLVRGHVVPAEVAYVGVGALAHGAPVDVALLDAKVPDRALGTGALGLVVASSRPDANAATTTTNRPLV